MALLRHLQRIGAGGVEFSFQSLLLMGRRELPWAEANNLWDCIFAQHLAMGHGLVHCSPCSQFDLQPTSDGQNPVPPPPLPPSLSPHLDDPLRSLAIHVSAALILIHRKSFMACKGLEEVVQLCHRLPDIGPGTGVRLARKAFELNSWTEPSIQAQRTFLCGCGSTPKL